MNRKNMKKNCCHWNICSLIKYFISSSLYVFSSFLISTKTPPPNPSLSPFVVILMYYEIFLFFYLTSYYWVLPSLLLLIWIRIMDSILMRLNFSVVQRHFPFKLLLVFQIWKASINIIILYISVRINLLISLMRKKF